MDSRAVQSHAHEYDEHHPHIVGSQQDVVAHGGEEHHHDHEKKSVLKKVKAKAKKIKDNITKHGHHDHELGHEYHYEDQHIPDDHDLDEEDVEDDEMVEDPEVHGAPIYDGAAVRGGTPGQAQNLGKPGVNFGGTTAMGEEPHHEPRAVVVTPTSKINQNMAIDPAKTFVEEDKGVQRTVNLERPMGLEEDPHAPGSRPEAHASANYQTKVTDPTGAGGTEIDITPVQKSFARMTVHNEPKLNLEPKVLPTVAETNYPSAGSHHQFVPELSPATKTHYSSAETHDQYLPQLSSEIKTQYPRSHDQFMPELPTATKTQYPYDKNHDHNLSEVSRATKTPYPSGGNHDQFVSELLSTAPKTQYPSAKSRDQNLPELSSATKTPYLSAGSHDQFVSELLSTAPKIQYPAAITHNQNLPELSSATKPQYPSVGSRDQFVPEFSTQTKAHYPSAGSHDLFATEPIPTSTNRYPENPQPTGQTFNTTTTTVEEQPQPQHESMEKQSNQSSYTDKISSATSAIADKAITAKNAVASKLGYGEKGDNDTDQNETRYHEEDKSSEKQSNQSSYTQKISSATSAVADKAVSAKNTVASKLGYGEKGDRDKKVTTLEEKKSQYPSTPTEYGKKAAVSLTEKLAPVYGKIAGVGSAVKSKVPGTERESVVMEQDKGVSVKDYLAEKMRPGDEDKALSEVISETLHKKKEEVVHGEEEDRDVKEVVSDAVHKREEEPERAEQDRALGKVTESEEVKRRLGSEDEETERRYEESYANSPGKGVVDKLKGMVGSWFGNTRDNQSSQGSEDLSRNSGAEGERVNRAAGERRLQESSN